jgi:hypothetical protein
MAHSAGRDRLHQNLLSPICLRHGLQCEKAADHDQAGRVEQIGGAQKIPRYAL